MLPVSGRDHRGKTVRLIDATKVLLSNRLSEADRSLLSTIIHVGDGSPEKFRAQSAWPFIAIAGALVGFVGLAYTVGLPLILGVVAWATVTGVAYWQRLRGAQTQEAADFLAERGICASCAYDLQALSKATDGCTICPECGAAWRVKPRDDQSSNASR